MDLPLPAVEGKYPVVLPKHQEAGEDQPANTCHQGDQQKGLRRIRSLWSETVPYVVGGHAYEMKKGQRFISNSHRFHGL